MVSQRGGCGTQVVGGAGLMVRKSWSMFVDEKDLLPCPFCGGKPTIEHKCSPEDESEPMRSRKRVRCSRCNVCTFWGSVCFTVWNNRQENKACKTPAELLGIVPGERYAANGLLYFCDVPGSKNRSYTQPSEADAKLFLAAPDLYNVVMAYRTMYDNPMLNKAADAAIYMAGGKVD